MFETNITIEGKTYHVTSPNHEFYTVDNRFTIRRTPKGWTCSEPIDIYLLNKLGEEVMDQVWGQANGF